MVKSLVDDIIMAPIGLLTGGIDFGQMFFVLKSGSDPGPHAKLSTARSSGATVIAYGSFINAVIALVIVALVLFFIIRWMEGIDGGVKS